MLEFQAGDILITGDLCVRVVGSLLSTYRRMGCEMIGDVNATQESRSGELPCCLCCVLPLGVTRRASGGEVEPASHRLVCGNRARQCLHPQSQHRLSFLPTSAQCSARPRVPGLSGFGGPRDAPQPPCSPVPPPRRGSPGRRVGFRRLLSESTEPFRKACVSICVRRQLHSSGLVWI